MRALRLTVAVLTLTAISCSAYSLDVNSIPYLSIGTKSKIESEFNNLSEWCKSTYAVAITRNGTWSSYCSRSLSTDEITRVVLEMCEQESGVRCGLVITSGKMVNFEEADQQISYPTEFESSSIPFVSDESRIKLRRYANAQGSKALAISRGGAYGYFERGSSIERAIRSALKFCEDADRNRRRCFVYAVDNAVVFDMFTDVYPE